MTINLTPPAHALEWMGRKWNSALGDDVWRRSWASLRVAGGPGHDADEYAGWTRVTGRCTLRCVSLRQDWTGSRNSTGNYRFCLGRTRPQRVLPPTLPHPHMNWHFRSRPALPQFFYPLFALSYLVSEQLRAPSAAPPPVQDVPPLRQPS